MADSVGFLGGPSFCLANVGDTIRAIMEKVVKDRNKLSPFYLVGGGNFIIFEVLADLNQSPAKGK